MGVISAPNSVHAAESETRRCVRVTEVQQGPIYTPTRRVPVHEDGSFDVEAQRELAARFATASEKKARLQAAKSQFDGVFSQYVATFRR